VPEDLPDDRGIVQHSDQVFSASLLEGWFHSPLRGAAGAASRDLKAPNTSPVGHSMPSSLEWVSTASSLLCTGHAGSAPARARLP